MTSEISEISERLPYPKEIIRSRIKFLEAVYFPESKTPEEVMGSYASISYIIKETLNRVLPDANRWRSLVEFTDYLAGSATKGRETAIRARFGFDDGRPKNWVEVGQLAGITRKAAYERVNSAITSLRAFDFARIVKIFNWQKEASK
jgi:DNA-directed RNA polymerase sigma subunit (sigma70/sigma32)